MIRKAEKAGGSQSEMREREREREREPSTTEHNVNQKPPLMKTTGAGAWAGTAGTVRNGRQVFSQIFSFSIFFFREAIYLPSRAFQG